MEVNPMKTTITIDEQTHAELKRYCKRHGISQGDFVKSALDYFRRSGIDPTDPPQSVKEELGRLDKRLNQVISFQRTFERENLLPLVVELRKQQGQINELLDALKSSVHNDSWKIKTLNLLKDASLRVNQLYGEMDMFKETNRLANSLQSEFRHYVRYTDDIFETQKRYLKAIYDYGAGKSGLMGLSIREAHQKESKP